MRAVTDATFESDVLAAAKPVVVDFWAPWCGPCKAIERALGELESAMGAIEFVTFDIDENPGVAARYDVLSLPTVMVFAGGELRETVLGARPKRHYERVLAPYA